MANDNYPPGAAQDSRAPWNEPDIQLQQAGISDYVLDQDSNEVDVGINYAYSYHDNVCYVKEFTYVIKDGEDHGIPKEILEEQIRDIISESHDAIVFP